MPSSSMTCAMPWREYQGKPLDEAMDGIVADEFNRETVLDTGLTKHNIDPKKSERLSRAYRWLV